MNKYLKNFFFHFRNISPLAPIQGTEVAESVFGPPFLALFSRLRPRGVWSRFADHLVVGGPNLKPHFDSAAVFVWCVGSNHCQIAGFFWNLC